jgi:hypothetical protein
VLFFEQVSPTMKEWDAVRVDIYVQLHALFYCFVSSADNSQKRSGSGRVFMNIHDASESGNK